MPSFPFNFSGSFGGQLATPSSVNPGALSETAEDILRKHLNSALKGRGWDAVIAAIATGEETNRTNARLAFDQLFTSSASGIYLIRRAADVGLGKPADLGMPDDLFRAYVIEVTNGKLVESSLLDVMEVFYGVDSVRAHEDTALVEPFALTAGDDLTVVFDGRAPILTVFTDADFALTSQAGAAEVAAALTRSFALNGADAFAVPVVDPQTGAVRVRLYSGSKGLLSSTQVVGGKAQTVLQFPALVPAFPTFAFLTWNVTFFPASNTLRFSPTAPFDVSLVQVGDYVTVYGPEFNVANRGTYAVTNVYWAFTPALTQYFDVTNLAGVTQAGVVQLMTTDLMVFRPTKATVHASAARAVVVAALPDQVAVVLPATSQAVGRRWPLAAYAQPLAGVAVSDSFRTPDGVVRVHAPNHGLSTGAQVLLDGLWAVPAAPPVTPGTHLNGGTADSSPATIVSALFTDPLHITQGIVAAVSPTVAITAGGQTGAFAVQSGTEKFTINGIATDPTTQALTVTSTYAASGATPTTTYFLCGFSVGGADPNTAGKVVATGGINAGVFYAHAALYAPAGAGAWTALPDMNNTRIEHAQVVLQDGRTLVVGGLQGAGSPLAATEALTSAPFAWTPMAPMGTPRFRHRAVVLQDGRVLVAGGANVSLSLNSCEVYDPGTDTWTPTGPMQYTRQQGHRLVLLPTGDVLVAGGVGYDPTQDQTMTDAPLANTEVWSPVTGRWRPAGALSQPHDTCFAVYLPSKNQVVLGGGTTDGSAPALSIELFNVGAYQWHRTGARLPAVMENVDAAVMQDDVVFIADPGSAAGTTGANVLYIPNSDAVAQGGANGGFMATVVDADHFTVATPGLGWTRFGNGGTVTALAAAPSAPEAPGPYVYDPQAGLAVTAVATTTVETLAAGQQYGFVDVADATQFPDAPGWLVFAFGYANQVAPVRYLGRLSNTRLALDFSFRFPVTAGAGTVVTLLALRGPFVPAHPEAVGSFYITASPAGRGAAEAAVEAAVAAGVPLAVTITYPGDRGLAGEGLPTHGALRLSDVVTVFAGNDIDAEVATARAS